MGIFLSIIIGIAVNVIAFVLPGLITGLKYGSLVRGIIVAAGSFVGLTIGPLICVMVFEIVLEPVGEASVGWGWIAMLAGVPLGWIVGIIVPLVVFVVRDRRAKTVTQEGSHLDDTTAETQ